MFNVISKSADQIGMNDIEALIASQVPEGEHIEFKESLSEGGKSPDPWIEGKDRIGDRARNKVLEEAVAFANAHGGILLIGIRESTAKPPVATEIRPLPQMRGIGRTPWVDVPRLRGTAGSPFGGVWCANRRRQWRCCDPCWAITYGAPSR